MLDFSRFEWLSFDCYGTLVDWESGISAAVDDVLRSHGMRRSRADILALFAAVEPRVQNSQNFLEYRNVLRTTMAAIETELGIQCTESELNCLADTLPTWPIFADVTKALQALKARYKLAVISNVDDDLFAGTARALNVEFDAVVTAEQARSDKPNLRNFDVASKAMAVGKEAWLHIAESLFHDIEPANKLGITCVWVDRAGHGGATRRTDAVPDLVVPDLATLAQIVGAT